MRELVWSVRKAIWILLGTLVALVVTSILSEIFERSVWELDAVLDLWAAHSVPVRIVALVVVVVLLALVLYQSFIVPETNKEEKHQEVMAGLDVINTNLLALTMPLDNTVVQVESGSTEFEVQLREVEIDLLGRFITLDTELFSSVTRELGRGSGKKQLSLVIEKYLSILQHYLNDATGSKSTKVSILTYHDGEFTLRWFNEFNRGYESRFKGENLRKNEDTLAGKVLNEMMPMSAELEDRTLAVYPFIFGHHQNQGVVSFDFKGKDIHLESHVLPIIVVRIAALVSLFTFDGFS